MSSSTRKSSVALTSHEGKAITFSRSAQRLEDFALLPNLTMVKLKEYLDLIRIFENIIKKGEPTCNFPLIT